MKKHDLPAVLVSRCLLENTCPRSLLQLLMPESGSAFDLIDGGGLIFRQGKHPESLRALFGFFTFVISPNCPQFSDESSFFAPAS